MGVKMTNDRVVVVVPLQEYGHIIPTLKLASRFQSDGFRVVYVVEEKFRSSLEEIGFECSGFPDSDIPLQKNGIGRYRDILEKFRVVLQKLEPEIALFDQYLSPYTIAAFEQKFRVCTFATVCDLASWRSAPFHSCEPRGKGAYARFENALGWVVHGIRHWKYYAPGSRQLRARRACIKNEFAKHGVRSLDFFYQACVADVDTIVFGPSSLSDGNLPPERYFGFCMGRPFENGNARAGREADEPRELVYVSLGSMSGRYPEASRLLAAIIEALKGKEYNVLVQAGNYFEALRSHEGVNIRIERRVDQVKVLGQASLAIIHGGYGSVKECIANGVPMAIAPFYHDQYKNAGIARSLGVGIMLDPRSCDLEGIRAAVDRLRLDESFRRRAATLYSERADSAEFDRAYSSLRDRFALSSSKLPSM